jgi:2-keto-4-pentenoate hydratase/2-oxohepta-3-ene-1,7-dioic acid hydratase in catechol pathway
MKQPCVSPSKIVCIGRNYAAHARELGNEVDAEPTLFLKPPSTLIASGEPIVRPRAFSEVVHHEGELGVVIGKRLHNATFEEAEGAISGYVVANDVTARDLQRGDKTWARGKGFDTFCPVGPAVLPASSAPPVAEMRIRVFVDGEVRQDGSCADMIFPVAACLAYASRVFTLLPGDLLLTGTPEGVGPLESGQTVRVEIDGVGAIENPVVDGPTLDALPDWRA